jgi:endonuclease YncB( thermonuclease family)
MTKTLLAITFAIFSLGASAADMTMPVLGVADGDTIRSSVKLPCPLCRVSVRIRGIDTPESNYLAKCPKERAMGLEAKAFLIEWASKHEAMMARNVVWDKYGGRIVADVELAGVSVGQEMINRGLARPYNGTGSKPNWCA